MKIDTSKIAGFDSMSAEEKLQALLDTDIENETKVGSNELDRLKQALSKANAEAAENKRKLRDSMSEKERTDAEKSEALQKMQEELETLRREKVVSGYTAKYLALGYSEDLAKSTAEAMANGDTDTVFANAQTYKTEIERGIRSEVMKGAPKPEGVGGAKKPTRDDILKIKDTTERQKAIAENIELFK